MNATHAAACVFLTLLCSIITAFAVAVERTAVAVTFAVAGIGLTTLALVFLHPLAAKENNQP